MLSDIERKILRILANYSAGRRRTPTVRELQIKTGRTEQGVLQVLSSLAQQEYIEWTPQYPNIISVLESWDREAPLSRYAPQKFDSRYSPFSN